MASRDDAAPDDPPTMPDVVLLQGPTADGAGAQVIRLREGRIETGEVRPLQEGSAITGEVVGLRPRPEMPRVCDVTVHARAGEFTRTEPAETTKALPHKGPARVNSAAFRSGWDALFAARDSRKLN